MAEERSVEPVRSRRTRVARILLSGVGIGLLAAAAASLVPMRFPIAEVLLVAGTASIAAAAVAEMAARGRVPSESPSADAAPASADAAPTREIPDDAPTSPRVPPAPAVAPTVRAPSTSIPGAYLAALDPPSDGGNPFRVTSPPPIVAALPFAAMSRPADGRPGPMGPTGEDPTALLDVELARLRASLKGMQHRPRATVGTSPNLSVSGARREISGEASAAGAVARNAVRRVGPTGAACADCGSATDPAGGGAHCVDCGRAFCADCSDRHAGDAGPALCDSCAGRESPSDGRATTGPAPSPTAAPGDPGWWDPDG